MIKAKKSNMKVHTLFVTFNKIMQLYRIVFCLKWSMGISRIIHKVDAFHFEMKGYKKGVHCNPILKGPTQRIKE